MEKQNLVVLVASLGALALVLVLGALLFRPHNSTVLGAPPSYTQLSESFGVVGITKDPSEEGYSDPIEQEILITTPSVISSEEKVRETPKDTLKDMPKPKIVRQTIKKTTPKAPPAAQAAPQVSKPTSQVSKPAPNTAAKLATLKTKKAAQDPRALSKYWIQVATYSRRHNAELAKEDLLKKGVVSHVFTYQKEEQTFYRLRMGPYTEKQAVKDVLAAIQEEEGLESSYIVG